MVAEYRYPIWDYADGMLFYEAGRVGSGIDDCLGVGGFHQSYGGGFRFRTKSMFFFQIQVAGSSEGVRVSAAFNESL